MVIHSCLGFLRSEAIASQRAFSFSSYSLSKFFNCATLQDKGLVLPDRKADLA